MKTLRHQQVKNPKRGMWGKLALYTSYHQELKGQGEDGPALHHGASLGRDHGDVLGLVGIESSLCSQESCKASFVVLCMITSPIRATSVRLTLLTATPDHARQVGRLAADIRWRIR